MEEQEAAQAMGPATEPAVNPRRIPPWKRPKAKPKPAKRPPDTRTKEFKQEKFLRAVTRIGTITAASNASKIDRHAHARWMQEDESYPARFADAQEQAADRLEAIAYRRAVKGDRTLLMFLLNGLRPWKFKYRQEITGPNGGPLQLAAVVIPTAVQQILASPLALGQELMLDERLLADSADRPAIAGDSGPVREADDGRSVLVPAAHSTISANGDAAVDEPCLQPDHRGGSGAARQE